MAWQPRTITGTHVVEPLPVAALSALFDSAMKPLEPGDALPPLWHWVALPRWSPSSILGADGHPQPGSFLPPLTHPRRMFAGGEVVLHSEIQVGSTVCTESTVASVTEKSGRSGPLTIVVVETRLYDQHGALALEERQDLIYRPAATRTDRGSSSPSPIPAAGPPLRPISETHWRFTTDPTLLMRFGAATANAHRIHYDWPYATQAEGYPGLVVHGPLMTLALAEVLRIARPDARVQRLHHRNHKPLFCGEPAHIFATGSAEEQMQLGLYAHDAAAATSPRDPYNNLTVTLAQPTSDDTERRTTCVKQ